MTVKKRILLVEDDGTTLRLVERMLEKQGFNVVTASCGEDGLATFNTAHFDVIVSDVQLPGMNGIEMCRQIKEIDPSVVPVVMTAREDQETAVQALKDGVTGFLKKPFRPQELEGVVRQAFARRDGQIRIERLRRNLLVKGTRLQRQVRETGRALDRTEQYLHHLLDAVPYAILSADADGQVLTANAVVERLYGCESSQIVGCPVATLFDPAEAARAPEGKKAIHRDSTGRCFPVLVRFRQVTDERNSSVADLYIIEDRSEREELEAQLLQADRLSLLGQLAPRIAHEFKTPLQVIAGYAELAAGALDGGREAEADDHVRHILPEVAQLTGLVQQMANLGKPTELVDEQIDVGGELERTLETLQGLGVVKCCEVRTDFDPAVPPIMGDRNQLDQVFRNLIVNAAQAMEESPEKILTVSVGVRSDGKEVEITVADTGCGIAADRIEDVFRPFFTTKGDGRGTGLGLPIVKSVLDRHGGEIRVESVESEGTRFRLTLPSVGPEHEDLS